MIKYARVAAVITEQELAITGGEEINLKVGMQGVLGEIEIFDPITYKFLGRVESYTIRVTEVHPRWARCRLVSMGYNRLVSRGDEVVFREED